MTTEQQASIAAQVEADRRANPFYLGRFATVEDRIDRLERIMFIALMKVNDDPECPCPELRASIQGLGDWLREP